jgi:hypothetical protein
MQLLMPLRLVEQHNTARTDIAAQQAAPCHVDDVCVVLLVMDRNVGASLWVCVDNFKETAILHLRHVEGRLVLT